MNTSEDAKVGLRIQELRKAQGLTQEQLARLSGVTYATITKLESGKIKNPSLQVVSKISHVLKTSLDQFSMVREIAGKDALKQLHEDILATLKPGDEMQISGIDEKKFLAADLKQMKKFIQQLKEHGLKQKLLSCSKDFVGFDVEWMEYRFIPEEFFSPVPIYCYGSKLASLVWGKPLQVVILNNAHIAESYRRQFFFMWQNAQRIDNKN